MAACPNTPPPATTDPEESESFYMRELPTDKLVGYDSTEGKALFKTALNEGGLEAFFPLSQQFLTQNEPACNYLVSRMLNRVAAEWACSLRTGNSVHDSECDED